MDFDIVIENARRAMCYAESQAKVNFNENALAQVALSYSILALADALYHFSTILKEKQIIVHGPEPRNTLDKRTMEVEQAKKLSGKRKK